MRSLLLVCAVLIACVGPTPSRAPCANDSECGDGGVCAPWGLCSEPCSTGQECLPGESCQPSADQAGDGPRWCALPCGGQDGPQQEVCDEAAGMAGVDALCQYVEYPENTDVAGWVCGDRLVGGSDGADDSSG